MQKITQKLTAASCPPPRSPFY